MGVLLALAAAGMAFAADVGHLDNVVVPPSVSAPTAVLDAVAGKPFTVGAAAEVSSALLSSLQTQYGASVVVLNIPSLTADAAGVFVFGINVSNMVVKDLSLYHFRLNRNQAAASAIDVPSGGYRYVDEKGNAISSVPANGQVFVAVNVPAAGTYNPVIAVQSEKGGSGGGCDAGFSFAGLFSLGALFLLKKGK